MKRYIVYIVLMLLLPVQSKFYRAEHTIGTMATALFFGALVLWLMLDDQAMLEQPHEPDRDEKLLEDTRLLQLNGDRTLPQLGWTDGYNAYIHLTELDESGTPRTLCHNLRAWPLTRWLNFIQVDYTIVDLLKMPMCLSCQLISHGHNDRP